MYQRCCTGSQMVRSVLIIYIVYSKWLKVAGESGFKEGDYLEGNKHLDEHIEA